VATRLSTRTDPPTTIGGTTGAIVIDPSRGARAAPNWDIR